MFLVRIVKKWWQARRECANRCVLDSCGAGSELRGTIEKRHPLSKIEVGARCRIDGYVVTETATSVITIGENTLLGARSIIDCADSVTIGKNVIISYDCVIADADNHSLSYSKRRDDLDRWRTGTHDWSVVQKKPIVISEGAWIGARSLILKGVTIGEGAIVGMGSVVTKDVAPYTIVAGNPARLLKEISVAER
jgi:acetyltransferase-like isoleucine patch superfamily enzyme